MFSISFERFPLSNFVDFIIWSLARILCTKRLSSRWKTSYQTHKIFFYWLTDYKKFFFCNFFSVWNCSHTIDQKNFCRRRKSRSPFWQIKRCEDWSIKSYIIYLYIVPYVMYYIYIKYWSIDPTLWRPIYGFQMLWWIGIFLFIWIKWIYFDTLTMHWCE